MTKQDWFWAIFGFTLISLCGYATYEIIAFFIEKLSLLNHNVAAAIIGAMATVFGSALVVVITQYLARQRAADESHRGKKVEIYKNYLEVFSKVLAGSNKDVPIKAPTEKELIKYMVGFKTEIILWGSPKVIKAQLAFEKASKNNGNVFIAANDLYLAIRKDIGLSNRGLSDYELIKMYLKDPEELAELIASNK